MNQRSAQRPSPAAVWTQATWQFIQRWLPPPPACVAELGCGEAGGNVPALLAAGYLATGIDPEAPVGAAYRQVRFEDYRPRTPVDAVIASVSLHHVDDAGLALDHVAGALAPGGVIVAVEWISERFDDRTARWCFGRRPAGEDEAGAWLAGLQAEWTASGEEWGSFFGAWIGRHGLHSAAAIRRELDARFLAEHRSCGPYYFPDLMDVDEHAEQAAIDAGLISAGCFRYVGRTAQRNPGNAG
jgi:SAM-dependent methyltransferase